MQKPAASLAFLFGAARAGFARQARGCPESLDEGMVQQHNKINAPNST